MARNTTDDGKEIYLTPPESDNRVRARETANGDVEIATVDAEGKVTDRIILSNSEATALEDLLETYCVTGGFPDWL